MKIIQTNILEPNPNIFSDFQSCIYEVNMKWEEFIESQLDESDISDKISNSTMQGVGKSINSLFDSKLLEKDDFHFSIQYKNILGGNLISLYYKVD